jgi:hypothetical protein
MRCKKHSRLNCPYCRRVKSLSSDSDFTPMHGPSPFTSATDWGNPTPDPISDPAPSFSGFDGGSSGGGGASGSFDSGSSSDSGGSSDGGGGGGSD